MKLKYFLFILILVYSCNTKKKELEQIIETWSTKKIVFPNLEAKYLGKDTIVSEIFNQDFKILTYIDTTGCTPCQLRLFDWKVLIHELKKITPNIEIIFVLFAKDFEEFEIIQQENNFRYPVFYDRTGKLDSINLFPASHDFKTFLLDKTNNVLAIGNPITNENIFKLYQNILSSYVKEEE